jgi:hypothetical protein
MTEDRQKMRGPVLGLVIVVTLAGGLLFGKALYHYYHFADAKAVTGFLMGVVAWIVAGKLYSAWRYIDE